MGQDQALEAKNQDRKKSYPVRSRKRGLQRKGKKDQSNSGSEVEDKATEPAGEAETPPADQ